MNKENEGITTTTRDPETGELKTDETEFTKPQIPSSKPTSPKPSKTSKED